MKTLGTTIKSFLQQALSVSHGKSNCLGSAIKNRNHVISILPNNEQKRQGKPLKLLHEIQSVVLEPAAHAIR